MGPFDPVLQLVASQARVRPSHVYHTWQALRVQGKQFHAAAFAQFASLEERHILAIIAALTDHDCLPEGRAKIERRAMRLPDDFTAPDSWIEWAVSKRMWAPDDAREEAEIFANYWQARSGAQAAKLNWEKTWQNWVRNSRRPDGTYQPSVARLAYDPERQQRLADLYDRMGRTQEAEEIRAQLASNVVSINRAIK